MTAAHPFVSRLRPWRSSIAAVAGLAMMVAPAFAATTRTLLTVSPSALQYGTPVEMTATVVTDATSFSSAPGHIGSGGNHTCAKSASGQVSCWGSNSDGQLGDGTTTESSLPVNVKTSSNSLLQGVDTIAVGGRNSCAVLTTDGKVMCWGANAGGQLGDGTKTSRTKADFVKKNDGDPFPNVAALSAGDAHTCAVLKTVQTVWCWGDNTNGGLGDGTKEGKNYPTLVQFGTIHQVLAISAGYRHTCALRSTGGGTVWCWGLNDDGQLGIGTQTSSTVPVQVTKKINGDALTGVTAIAAGAHHTCAIVTGGEVYCWGRGASGQLGNKTKTGSPSPVQVYDGATYMTGATVIDANDARNCAIKGNEVRCWGAGDFGANGDGSNADATTAATVKNAINGSTLANATAIAVGESHTCALVNTTRAKCWGNNAHGQIGDGSTKSWTSAVNVQRLIDGAAKVTFNVEGPPSVLLGEVMLSSGKATLVKPDIGGGSLVLTASYVGDATDSDSISSPTSILVNGAPTNDLLTGSADDDILDGGAGADKMVGLDGNDIYYVDNPGDVVEEKSNEGTDLVYSSISYVLPPYVENLILTGGAPISGSGNAFANIIKGNAAANTLQGFAGNDVLYGGGGDDILDGGAGNDKMIGGTGDDLYVVDSQSDIVLENANEGEDTIRTDLSYTLPANVERLELTGVAPVPGNGNALDNTLIGNAGANRLSGFAGDDVIEGGPGADTLDGGPGNDTLSFAGSKAGVTADLKEKVIDGDAVTGFENLRGSAFADRLTGDDKANRIEGGDGDDVIAGRKGKDVLVGGKGKDSFVYFNAADSRPKKPDVIEDFSVADGDRIDLSSFDRDLRKKGRQRFTSYRGTKRFTRVPGQLRFSKGALLGDVDGDGKADFKVVLKGVKKLPKKALKLK